MRRYRDSSGGPRCDQKQGRGALRVADQDFPPGSLWRHVSLGTESIYEVVRADQQLVEVTVRSAPGLDAGFRLRLTRDAVARMERVDRARG